MFAIPERLPGESELSWLRRKEVAFGWWQAEALEALADNERVIGELRAMLASGQQAAINLAFDSLSTAQAALLPFVELTLVADEKPKKRRVV